MTFSSTSEISKLHEEFVQYQLLNTTDIPEDIWKMAAVAEEDGSDSHYRMDVIWNYLSTKKHIDGRAMFGRLFKIAEVILIIPHSNADEERVFSMVRKNKTPFRSSLSLDNTLSGLLSIKLGSREPCYKFSPTDAVIDKAKKVTWEYNKAHMCKKNSN